jgi:FAD/FMN-containing dehydrogenases
MAACEDVYSLRIRGSGSKDFYGRAVVEGALLELKHQRGIVYYEPRELVVTARTGTPLAEIEATLAQQAQMLAFEPPYFGAHATLGGTVACGLSGPRRPYSGAARDFVLGVKTVNGKGDVLCFGGQVMKNVAGYDLARLLTGSLGTLGILLEVSLKVMPLPACELSLRIETDPTDALRHMNAWAGQPLPLSASCYDGEALYFRLSGTQGAVRAARNALGGDEVSKASAFWESLREHRHSFFAGATPVWRISLAPATPAMNLPGRWLLDWGGAQRWLKSEASCAHIRAAVEAGGGHATLFRGGNRAGEVFHPLAPSLHSLHRRLKNAFDPKGILNPGRMYRDW